MRPATPSGPWPGWPACDHAPTRDGREELAGVSPHYEPVLLDWRLPPAR
ncbi:hypothetical protein QTQ03_08935 [Micromonospora sp. WMMA1363]|nr:hypothetical protein [Micromonospora sp. WMMA1363]MDM4719696.1 hypothetical protein [Micromonospora sp. WMMA1363]